MPEINQGSISNQENKPVPNLRNQVLDYLKTSGPAVPVVIAQNVKRESYFVGAILSELMESKQIKLSHAKIGGSRVYYLPGQEEKLSILYKYLPDAEKKVYDLLKEKELLKASELEPVQRVALDNLKDFSNPTLIDGEKAWIWYLSQPKQQVPIPIQETQKTIAPIIQKPQSKEDLFSTSVENYLRLKNIKLLQKEVVRKNSETNYIIQVESQIGPIPMFVCAKNKKKISDQDIMLANQKGQNRKMSTLFLTTGEQTKKAKEYLEKNLKGSMIFRNI
jgi:hypothetical protein